MLQYNYMAFVYCFLGCGAYLLILEYILYKLENIFARMGMWGDTPEEKFHSTESWFQLSDFMAYVIFYICIPTFVYLNLGIMLPFEGPRAGVAIALWSVAIGGLPIAVTLLAKLKLPVPAMAFFVIGHLLRLAGSLALIGIILSL